MKKIVIILTTIFLFNACSSSNSNGEKFLGKWKVVRQPHILPNNYDLTISKGGNMYLVAGGNVGTTTYTLSDGILKGSGNMGNIMYNETNHHIYFFTGEYEKVPEGDQGQNADISNVSSAWQKLELLYKRRIDVTMKLVNTVETYLKNDSTFIGSIRQAVTNITSIKVDPNNPTSDQLQKFDLAQQNLSASLSQLLAITENYPGLKKDHNFVDTRNELEDIENRINVSRKKFESSKTVASQAK